jgi:acetyl-CoA synthetase
VTTSSLIPVKPDVAAHTRVDGDAYARLYRESVQDSEGFWRREGQRLDWIVPYTQVRDVSFDSADLHIRWFGDGVLNASANCLDRHLASRGDKTAIIWEPDDPTADARHISYRAS